MNAIETSQNQIYEIAEESRKNCRSLEADLSEVKSTVEKVINEVETLVKEERSSRYNLMIANKDFNNFREKDVKKAYDRAKSLQLKLVLKRNEEKILIERRTDLELRLKTARETLKKAESLVSQIGVVLGYLSGDLKDINVKLEGIKERQYLGIKVIKAQEEERHRLSREIHDGPAQSLANIILKTELCEKLMDINKEEAKEELRTLRETMRISLKDVRKIIYDLRPMSLDDLGLIPTIEILIEQYIEDTGLHIELNVFGDRKKLMSIIELAAFRIIQESLTNIQKHSRATMAFVKVEFMEKNINLVVSDNGVGFDKNSCRGMDKEGGYGLLSMKERVELLDGKLDIVSKPGKGTKIIVSIPINVYEEVE